MSALIALPLGIIVGGVCYLEVIREYETDSNQPGDSPPPTVTLVLQSGQARFSMNAGQTHNDFDELGRTLRVRVNQPVRIRLHSNDFVYLLKLKNLKNDLMAIPDMVFDFKIQFDRPSTYAFEFSPMCGYRGGHTESLASIEVHD